MFRAAKPPVSQRGAGQGAQPPGPSPPAWLGAAGRGVIIIPARARAAGPEMSQGITVQAIGLTDHPLRHAITDEIHARPVEPMPPAGAVTRVAVLLQPGASGSEATAGRFARWCVEHGLPAPRGRQHTYEAAGYRVTWEMHTEFVTLTWYPLSQKPQAWPAGIGLETLTGDLLLVAARVELLPESKLPANLIAALHPASLAASAIEDGRGQIASDLVPDTEGFTRLFFATGDIPETRRAVVVRRLLEVETYRVLTLLALPLARELSARLATAESDLSGQMEAMGEVDTIERSQAALAHLEALAVTAGKLQERISYRFAASFAYGAVLGLRLDRLAERSLGQGSTLKRYLDNRIAPALATCHAFEERLTALTSKLDRAIGLLNTRISVDMQTQNRAALATISKTAQSQYRLQMTVEGLSTIAISYYALGILGYVLTGAGVAVEFSEPIAVAAAAPLVMLLVWAGLRWIQRGHR